MKKTMILLALLLVLVLVFAGCQKNDESEAPDPNFILDGATEDLITVTMNGASAGSGGVGYLTFDKGEQLGYLLNSSNGNGKLSVVIFHKEDPENPMSYVDPDSNENVLMAFTVDSNTSGTVEIEPGEYALLIEVESGTLSGIATFDVISDGSETGLANPWTTVDSADQVDALCGFLFGTPETLGGMRRDTVYSVAQDLKIAGVSYLSSDADGGEQVKGEIRKTIKHMYDPAQKGPLSGVWDEYDEEKVVDGVQLFIKDGLVRVAEWESDNFRYSIWCEDGLTEEDMMAAVMSVE